MAGLISARVGPAEVEATIPLSRPLEEVARPGAQADRGKRLVSVAQVAITLGATKAFSYAIWFGMPLVAAAGARLLTTLRLTMLASRAGVALLLTPTAISAGAIMAADAAGLEESGRFSDPDDQACMEMANYATVARLPPGLLAPHPRGAGAAKWVQHRPPSSGCCSQWRAQSTPPASSWDEGR